MLIYTLTLIQCAAKMYMEMRKMLQTLLDPSQVILDTKALAEREGVKVNTVRVWEMKGRAPKSFRPGGGRLVRYRLSDVIAWEEANFQEAA